MKKDIDNISIEAAELIAKECVASRDIWHPDFGWILIDGVIKNEQFIKWLGKIQ